MAEATEIFIFRTTPENRAHAVEVLKELQQEIIEAGAGSVRSVRTLLSDSDEGTISQIYEWSSQEESQRVFALFFSFKNAQKLQALNEQNIFMGRMLEQATNAWRA